MALSDDQKAILRLLSQRGEQGYEDLSALMGISVEEVTGGPRTLPLRWKPKGFRLR